jgi:UDP-GlcNAc:undecaprenyl-phosphate GlcNAc-1-phosphate transferase
MIHFFSVASSFFLALLLSVCIAPLVIRWYRHKQWLEQPRQTKHIKHLHTEPVPRGGGFVVGIPLLFFLLFFLPLNIETVAIVVAVFGLIIVGFLDDLQNLSPYLRLGIGIILSIVVALSGVELNYITHPLQEGVLQFDQFSIGVGPLTATIGQILAVIWIVWNMNIVNWSKGLDGQQPGVVGIAAFFIGILALRFASDPSQHPVILLSFAVSGAFFGLLFWNAYPQKIMPGYGAGSLGGFFLAVLSILSGAKLATALLVLAIPTADALFTILRRILQKKSPFWGDRGHFHHKLLDVLGWSKPQIAWFYWLTTAIFGVLALQLKPEQKVFTIVGITALVFGFLIWVKLFFSSSNRPDPDNG